jgi:hypothetical protein
LYKGLSGILKKRGQALWLLQVTADDLLYNKVYICVCVCGCVRACVNETWRKKM